MGRSCTFCHIPPPGHLSCLLDLAIFKHVLSYQPPAAPGLPQLLDVLLQSILDLLAIVVVARCQDGLHHVACVAMLNELEQVFEARGCNALLLLWLAMLNDSLHDEIPILV